MAFYTLIPHLEFVRAEKLLDQQMKTVDDANSAYISLGAEMLDQRLNEEHERAREMDDKTSKLTTSPSAALALLGFAVPVALREISTLEVDITIAVLSVLLAAFLLDTLYLVLGAVRTVERFGYGSTNLLQLQDMTEEEALVRKAANLRLQEIANLRRHNRNAASFSTLQNAFMLAVAVLAVALIALLVETV